DEGAVAQLGGHLVCNQGVRGSNPLRSMGLTRRSRREADYCRSRVPDAGCREQRPAPDTSETSVRPPRGQLPPNLTAREVTWPRVGRRHAIVGVRVDVREAGPHGVEQRHVLTDCARPCARESAGVGSPGFAGVNTSWAPARWVRRWLSPARATVANSGARTSDAVGSDWSATQPTSNAKAAPDTTILPDIVDSAFQV